jgi:hypothetical protein
MPVDRSFIWFDWLPLVRFGATPHLLDRFPGNLSYDLRMLIDCDCVEVYYGGWFSAMGRVWSLVVVEGDPAPDADPRLRSGFPSVQIDEIILQEVADVRS